MMIVVSMCGRMSGGSLWEFFKYPSLVLGAKLGSFSGCNKKTAQQSYDLCNAVPFCLQWLAFSGEIHLSAKYYSFVFRFRGLVLALSASGSSMLAMARTC